MIYILLAGLAAGLLRLAIDALIPKPAPKTRTRRTKTKTRRRT